MYSSNWFARVAVVGLFMAALIALPATANAQIGTLAGKVVDADNKPIQGATVIFDNPENGLHFEAKTNAKGEWTRPGLMLTGKWVITVQKDNMSAKLPDIPIRMNSVTEMPTVTLTAPKPRTGLAIAGVDPAKKAASDKLATEVQAALDANDYDTAISKLNELAALVDKCSICYTAIGNAYMKKGENPNAETAYLKSIEMDASAPEPYESLANIYNQFRKYDEAAKMAEKASSLKAAKTGGAILDPESEYNAAVIAYNGSKIPEARTHLEAVLKIKPEHAEAHYLYGMVLINQNKIPEAKKEFQKYLELAPTGPNADMAKAIVAMP